MDVSRFGLVAFVLITGLSCSPAADRVGKGNVHFQITYSTIPDVQSCGLPSVGGIGSPPPHLPSGDGTFIADFGDEVADGESVGDTGEYVVKCTVTSGGRFDIEMEGPNSSPSAGQDQGTEAGLRAIGTVSTSTGTGTGSITVRTTTTGSATSDSTVPCQLTAVRNSEGKHQVSKGQARFTFVCPRAVAPRDEFGVCETRGTVSVRDCVDK